MMNKAMEELCAQRLRELRRSKGITLNQFEKLSNGAIKAVVLGSYERGTRAISLARLEQLADIYEVPFQYFFNVKSDASRDDNNGAIFDLRRIRNTENHGPQLAPVKRFLNAIAEKRADWNGEVMSLRHGDNELLSLICGFESKVLFQELKMAGFLFASEVSGRRSP